MKITFILDSFPTLSETFLYTLLENLSAAGMQIAIRARRRGSAPHRPALQDVEYLPLEEWPIIFKFFLLGWYTLRLLVTSPRGFGDALRYLQTQSGGLRVRSMIAYRIFPLLCEKADSIYLSFGGLAVKYVDLFALHPNVFFSLRGSDINIEPLLDGKYAETLKSALQKARKVHCVSRDIQQKAIRMSGQTADKFQVIYTSINPIFFQEGETAKPTDEITIVSVGRLDWRKGFEHGMMAIRELLQRGVACSWTIIGEGPYRVALEWAVRDMDLSGHVTFLGGKSQGEVAQTYREAHIYFHPSVHEGISNSVLEAMAAGLPVVVSNVGGMPEVIEHGKHGFLVEPRNWKEMADALEQLARNAHLREVISTACREKVRGQLTRENQVAGFKKFFGFSS
jgi:colanic acid/amylovoran biosynthesis glycosyltransferase